MKVRAIASSFENAPEEALRSGWSKECNLHITTGREYDVYAISLFGLPEYGRPRILTFQIIESNSPSWLPSFLFEVVEPSLPKDWECNLFPSGNFVIGPAFVVETEDAYGAMVEQEPDAMRKFRARQREIESPGRGAHDLKTHPCRKEPDGYSGCG